MKPSHGQLLALYYLLIVDSALYRYVKKNIKPGDAANDGGLVSNLTEYFKMLQISFGPLPDLINLYDRANSKILQDPSTVFDTLGLKASYGSGSGPCPSVFEEAAIFRALDQQFPWPDGLKP